MVAEDVDKQRCVRFYQWAKSDLEREIAQDYPFLRKIPSVDAGSYLELSQSLPPARRSLFASTHLRWSHSTALALLGDPFRAEEKLLLDDYQRERRLIDSRIEQKLKTPLDVGSPMNSRSFRRLVQAALEPVVQGKPKPDWPDLLFVTPVGEWFIGTQIQIMDKGSRLRYYQSVMIAETDYVFLPCPSQNATNLLGWLGAGRRDWEIPFDEMAETAAETLALICDHYIRSIASTLEGLHPEEQSSWDGVHWWQRK